MATITVRKLDGKWDPQRGVGLGNFIEDQEAVEQIIATTLKLLQGEWFEALSVGTPLFQQLLGHPMTEQGVVMLLRKRILSVPYVIGIDSASAQYASANRAYSFTASVRTAFGTAQVTTALPV